MITWQQSELEIIAATDEVTLAVEHRDGSAGTPVIMWSVVVDGQVYVRAVRGEASPWYRRALITGRGEFAVGSVRVRVVVARRSIAPCGR